MVQSCRSLAHCSRIRFQFGLLILCHLDWLVAQRIAFCYNNHQIRLLFWDNRSIIKVRAELNRIIKTETILCWWAGLRSRSRKESEFFGWSRNRIPENTGSRIVLWRKRSHLLPMENPWIILLENLTPKKHVGYFPQNLSKLYVKHVLFP